MIFEDPFEENDIVHSMLHTDNFDLLWNIWVVDKFFKVITNIIYESVGLLQGHPLLFNLSFQEAGTSPDDKMKDEHADCLKPTHILMIILFVFKHQWIQHLISIFEILRFKILNFEVYIWGRDDELLRGWIVNVKCLFYLIDQLCRHF